MTEKKVWLITGAGRGLGVDIVKAVLAAGHFVVATGRDPAKVAAAVGDHDNLLVIKLDVIRPQDAQAAVEAAVAKFGRIDILVNNAGSILRKPAAEHPDEYWDQVMEVNLNSQFVLSRELGREMIARGSGKIIFTALTLLTTKPTHILRYQSTQ